MARRKHTLLYVAGAGLAGWAAYQYLYKPWKAQQDAAAGGLLPGGGAFLPGGTVTGSPPLGSLLPAPGGITPIGWTSLGPQYGGVLGACIAKKGGTWSPEKCQARLNDLVNAARTAKAQITALQGGSLNPNAAGIPAAQLALAQTQAALANATERYNATAAAGDTNAAAIWHAAIGAHQADIGDLVARIAAAGKPVDNSAAIAAYEGALAGNDNDYFNLTGTHLIGAV